MKKSLLIIAAIVALSSCQALKEEWQPVFSPADNPPEEELLDLDSKVNTTIAELKANYKVSKEPVKIMDEIWIKGQVISTDRTGNVYRELYIQDESGVLDVKVGRSAMYADYVLGQWIYIYCKGLTLGEYDGTLQLGVTTDDSGPNAQYEVSYIDVQSIIEEHIFKGRRGEPIKAVEVTEEQIKAAVKAGKQDPLWGRYVIVKDLQYGCKKDYYTHVNEKVFFFIYVDPNAKDKKAGTNRFFFSDGTYSIDTWAINKERMVDMLKKGQLSYNYIEGNPDRYDDPLGEGINLNLKAYEEDMKADGITLTDEDRELYRQKKMDEIIRNATAQSISHYFLLPGNQEIAIRSSGYGKFADKKIPAEVLGEPGVVDGKKITVRGLLGLYIASSGSTPQITFIEDPVDTDCLIVQD